MLDCKTTDTNGLHYDLTPLMLRSENYVIPVGDPKATIILNVCHSVVHNDGAACQGHSGACLREVGSDEKYAQILIPQATAMLRRKIKTNAVSLNSISSVVSAAFKNHTTFIIMPQYF